MIKNQLAEARPAVKALNQSSRVRNVKVTMPIKTAVIIQVEKGGFSRLLIVGIRAITKIN